MLGSEIREQRRMGSARDQRWVVGWICGGQAPRIEFLRVGCRCDVTWYAEMEGPNRASVKSGARVHADLSGSLPDMGCTNWVVWWMAQRRSGSVLGQSTVTPRVRALVQRRRHISRPCDASPADMAYSFSVPWFPNYYDWPVDDPKHHSASASASASASGCAASASASASDSDSASALPYPFLSSPSPDSDSQPPRTSSSPLSPSPAPSVKEEPDDVAPGCFIMELSTPQASSTLLSQSLAPPTEVPLRATQASTDMRRMMTVFRLNPFTMHSGPGRGTVPVHYDTAQPLDSEPITFEFQLDIDPAILDPDPVNDPDLRAFSPDFELHDKSADPHDPPLPSDPWYDFPETSSTSSPPPPWNLSYPDSDDHFPSINISAFHHPSSSRRPPPPHSNDVHPTYTQKPGPSGYNTSSSSSGVHYHSPPTSANHRLISPQPPEADYPQPQWDHTHSQQRPIGYQCNSAAASRSSSLCSSGYTDVRRTV
ncbi:hypothetical protein H0H87_010286 [Tephrocybe sp. NHM501043]|nr:hypothetical protein H0H87_010286 [Tephrocybe sp. NHM501043]